MGLPGTVEGEPGKVFPSPVGLSLTACPAPLSAGSRRLAAESSKWKDPAGWGVPTAGGRGGRLVCWCVNEQGRGHSRGFQRGVGLSHGRACIMIEHTFCVNKWISHLNVFTCTVFANDRIILQFRLQSTYNFQDHLTRWEENDIKTALAD